MSKLNKKRRLEIYHDWKLKNKSFSAIAAESNLNEDTLRYMIHLIDRYGIDIYDKKDGAALLKTRIKLL